MNKNDEHLVQPKISSDPQDVENMDVDLMIDKRDYGNNTVPKPGVPLEDWQIRAFNRIKNYDRVRDGSTQVNPEDEEFGTRLLTSLLATDEAYFGFKDTISSPNDKVILDVMTSDPDLLTYPWETCAHANWEQLGLPTPANLIAVTRTTGTYLDTWPAKEPIRILVVGVSARNLSAPNFDKEFEAVETGLLSAGLEKNVRFEIFPLRETTLNKLQQAVYNYQPHIVHMVTHGGFGQHYLEASNGQPVQVSSSLLADALTVGEKSLCLFVSTACMAMQENLKENVWGLGRRLSSFVPITIGMQIVISEEAALEFTSEFYSAIAAPTRILGAFVRARERIKTVRPGSPEWIAPVLYRGLAKNEHLFSENSILFLLDSLISNLDSHIQGLRRDNYNSQLWVGIYGILNEIDVRLVDGYQNKEYQINPEQLPMLSQIKDILEEDLGSHVNTINRFFELCEKVQNKIELADLEFKYDIAKRISYSLKLTKNLRNALMQWREFYS